MKITNQIDIHSDYDSVWKSLAEDFDAIDQWHKPVIKSYDLPNQKPFKNATCAGRVCEFTHKPNGPKAWETITEFDKDKGRLGINVSVLDAGLLPVKSNTVLFKVVAVTDSLTRIEFYTDLTLKLHGYPLYPLLRLGLGKSFDDLLKAFKKHMESSKMAAA